MTPNEIRGAKQQTQGYQIEANLAREALCKFSAASSASRRPKQDEALERLAGARGPDPPQSSLRPGTGQDLAGESE